MTISLDWLNDFLTLEKYSIDDISMMLTDIGLEVEDISTFESIKGGLAGVVIGEVITCEKHPNADKLSITTVNIGQGPLLNIVCGAPNVAQGQKVLVATIGTTIHLSDGKSFEIKAAKIRGVDSEGMICASDELGLGDDHSGIIVLPSDVNIGMKASEYFQVHTDTAISIGLTPNRSDATCHKGVADDLAAAYDVRFGDNIKKSINHNTPEFSDQLSAVPVTVKNVADCPRYTGILLENIKIKPSPAWMQNRLKTIGVRPINNVVDITNFVLHELGQPLHAFDFDQINGEKIKVQTLPDQTVFVSLDGIERKLSSNDLMICDGEDNPMCIAGVFGGLSSGVTEKTTRVFLESAHFSASKVRKSSMMHNLRSDAARIFEKGSDPNICLTALYRAVELLGEYADATIASSIVDCYPNKMEPTKVQLRPSKLNDISGITFEKAVIEQILSAMSMPFSKESDYYLVNVPTNKADVTREIDLIEEIIRIYGMNNIPYTDRIQSAISFAQKPDPHTIQESVGNFLAANGFLEAMSLSIIPSQKYANQEALIKINNTSNVHLDAMRPLLEISLLDNIAFNINRQQTSLKIFEFGNTYSVNASGDFEESQKLCIGITGLRYPEQWNTDKKSKTDYYSIKGIVEAILSWVGIKKLNFKEFHDEYYAFGLEIYFGAKNLGKFGAISTSMLKANGLKQDVYAASLDWKAILGSILIEPNRTEAITKFPQIIRDIALILPNEINYIDLEKEITKQNHANIKSVTLFDIYKNENQLGKGLKSYAIRIVFEDMNATMEDKLIDGIMEKINQKLSDKFGAKLRE